MFEQADWIWKEKSGVNEFIACEKDFLYEEGDVLLRLSCESDYAVYINRTLVFCGQYFSYEDYKIYDEIPVEKFLAVGKNTIKIIAHHGGEGCLTYKEGIAGIIYEVTSGKDKLCSSAVGDILYIPPEYLPAPYDVSPQIGKSINFDFTKKNESCFRAVSVPKDKNVFPRFAKKCELKSVEENKGLICAQGYFEETDETAFPSDRLQTGKMSARSFYSMTGISEDLRTLPNEIRFMSDGSIYFLVDLEREKCGYFDFDLQTNRETEMLVGYGEHLDDLRPRCSINGRNFAFSYHLPVGRVSFTQPFKRIAARYLMCVIKSGGCILYRMGIRGYDYPLAKTEIRLSDRLHQKILEMSKNTLALCLHEHYEDTPWREQALFGKDFYNQMLCDFYAFGEYDMAKASLKLILRSVVEKDDMFDISAPAESPIRIPSYSLNIVCAMMDYYRYTGDAEFTKNFLLPVAGRVLEGFLSRVDKNGLLPIFSESEYWNFYEWRQGLDGGDIFRTQRKEKYYDLPLNALFILALRAVDEVQGELTERKNFAAAADKIAAATDKTFFDEEKGIYATRYENRTRSMYHEYCQALMILVGTKKQKSLETAIKEKKLLPVVLPDLFVKYDALMKCDRGNVDYILNDIERIYGKMLTVKEPTAWEVEEGASAFFDAGSCCHGWSCAPIWFYYKYLLGAEYDRHTKTVAFHPLKAEVKVLRAEYRTPKSLYIYNEENFNKTGV